MDIYIKPKDKVKVTKTDITVGDASETLGGKRVGDIPLITLNRSKKVKHYVVSALDIIKAIMKKYPEASVINVGEKETVISYSPDNKPRNPILQFLMITFVTITLALGSATAIMSFHGDAGMPEIFSTYHKIFFGQEKENPLIIEIPYSIGLATGIIVFFNHFLGRKITDDPTPIEVEMTEYDKEVTDTILNSIEKGVEP
ncbi:MAG: stage V sporulation protein AA [Clostridiales bacterium]|jgi:stage V sporulation protein AA|nr:stage V sporulation protein AA [Clostridiales bacterium]